MYAKVGRSHAVVRPILIPRNHDQMSSCFCPNAVNLFVGLLIGNLNCASIAANIDDHYDGVLGGVSFWCLLMESSLGVGSQEVLGSNVRS